MNGQRLGKILLKSTRFEIKSQTEKQVHLNNKTWLKTLP